MSILVVLRQMVVALILLGLASGTMVYAMPSTMDQVGSMTTHGQNIGTPCGKMSATLLADGTASKGKMPCNTITPDCVKQMACLQTAALPERAKLMGSAAFAEVIYLTGTRLPTGLTLEPELSPPLAA
ncbi:MAG: hypothetical protein J0H14_22720 [Alphaproteobacteria bacterium]|nr:hypothetical protein [Alphaproteobacteria bacterium]